MMVKLLGLGRRQLHTIISRQTIKPSSRTSSHLETYNLSSLDQLFPHMYMPLILLYPNNSNLSLLSAKGKAQVMTKSLSQSLAKYYPFAGRVNRLATPCYIDCNDQGVVFVEAKTDSQLKEVQHLISEQDEVMDQFFADDMVGFKSSGSTSLVGVQVNHLRCGGMAVGVSMSHTIGDGCTLGSFVNHWASVARYGSTDHKEVLPLNPHFIQSPRINSILPKIQLSNVHQGYNYADRVTRKFVFPNTKLIDLKNKVIASSAASGTEPPTRVEVLTSLLYKTAVSATTAESGFFTPSYLIIPVNIRNKFVQKLPQTTVGNFLLGTIVGTRNTNETSLSKIVSKIKKGKSQLEEVQSVQHAAQNIISSISMLGNQDVAHSRSYVCSSLCGFPYDKADFGWGMPVDATTAMQFGDQLFVLKDSRDGDGGIEAMVILQKQVMEIFENDKEMLSFCNLNHILI